MVALFNDARGKDYDAVAETLALLIKDQNGRKANPEAFANQRQKLISGALIGFFGGKWKRDKFLVIRGHGKAKGESVS